MTYSLKSRSERRARLFLGGTYFRAKKIGLDGNKISVQVYTHADNYAKFIVTNYSPCPEEQVKGPVNVDFLECKLKWNEGITIDSLTTTPRARGYSISWQIAGGTFQNVDHGEFSFSRVFRLPGKLTVKLSPAATGFDASRVVLITPRCRTYELRQKDDGGWDIPDLRSQMESDPWVEMLPRGTDEHDSGVDDASLTPFSETFLKGGDGLPDHPAGHEVGPDKYLVVLQETEAENGELLPVNQVLEWNDAWVPRE